MKNLKFVVYIAVGVCAYFFSKKLNLPTDTLNILIASLVASVIWLSQQYLTSGRSEGTSKAQITSLEKEKDKIIFDSNKQISDLEANNNALEKELLKYTHKEKILSDHQWNENMGIYFHKTTGVATCPNCLNSFSNPSPLHNQAHGWQCYVCDKYIPRG